MITVKHIVLYFYAKTSWNINFKKLLLEIEIFYLSLDLADLKTNFIIDFYYSYPFINQISVVIHLPYLYFFMNLFFIMIFICNFILKLFVFIH
jgi:hypothetical protein